MRVSQFQSRDLRSAVFCLVVFLIIFLPAVYLANRFGAGLLKMVVLCTSGWLLWTFVEYFMHRFWMHSHFRQLNSKIYETHMHHHKHPKEISIKSWHRGGLFVVGFMLLALAWMVNNNFSIFVGFYWGFVLYSILHWVLHHKLGTALFPRVQRAHIHHHGKYPDKGYSFSTIIWDWIFGTLPPKDAKITRQMIEFYFKNDSLEEATRRHLA